MINSLIFNVTNSVLTLYLFIVFTWWWVKLKNATDVYKMTTVLMFGLMIQFTALSICNFQAYFFAIDYDEIVSAWFIAPSKFIVTISLIWYANYVSKKIFIHKNMGRRIDDQKETFENDLKGENCPHKEICNMFPNCVKK